MVNINVLIVTGLYNSGQRELEESLKNRDVYSIHNLPVQLIKELVLDRPDFIMNSEFLKNRRIAFFVDINSGDNFADELIAFKRQAKSQNLAIKFLFLDQSESKLLNSYKEKRLVPTHSDMNLSEALKKEIQVAAPLKQISDFVFNVDDLGSRELKVNFRDLLNEIYEHDNEFTLELQSFGYKYGLPMDSDLVLDVRFLPNPYYIPELRTLKGTDGAIKLFLEGFPDTKECLNLFERELDYLLPKYAEDGRNILRYAIGCTGGKHRSVYVVEELAKRLSNSNYKITLRHRDIEKD